MNQTAVLSATLCAVVACDGTVHTRVVANGQQNTLQFDSAQGIHGLKAVGEPIEIAVSRIIRRGACNWEFMSDVCLDGWSEIEIVKLPATSIVSASPSGIVTVNSSVDEHGVLHVSLSPTASGNVTLAVSAGEFSDTVQLLFRTPTRIVIRDSEAAELNSVRFLPGASVPLSMTLEDENGGKVRSLHPVTWSVVSGGGASFSAPTPPIAKVESATAGTTRFLFRHASGVTGALDVIAVPDEEISVAEFSPYLTRPDGIRCGRTPEGTIIIAWIFTIRLRDASGNPVLGGPTRFVTDNPEILAVRATDDGVTLDGTCGAPGQTTLRGAIGAHSVTTNVTAE